MNLLGNRGQARWLPRLTLQPRAAALQWGARPQFVLWARAVCGRPLSLSRAFQHRSFVVFGSIVSKIEGKIVIR